ncbi:hypothetical protein NT6N_29170 [Oceaniferula spumae]|uniref:Cytochrome c domain-containing protein n=1 Tax=Oceaniferula spumae TaxID=2979115 RepID=A0AAT9FPQ5_9BACT
MRYTQFIASFSLAVVTATAAPNYEDDIFPIFEKSCNNCHNPDKQKGDLDLTSYSALMRGGSGGKVAEPGEGADSKIYGVITHTLKPKMPPKGEKLSKKDADLIRAWIDAGLLENKTGKPKKKSKPSFSISAAPSAGKPDGPPPMPSHLLLEPVVETPRATAVTDMAVSPWAPLLAVTGQRQVLLYNTSNLQLVGILPFDYGQPASLSFHASGKYLLAGGGVGGKSGTTVTWEIETGKQILTAGKDFDSVLAASLRADLGGVSLGGPGKRVKLWNTSTDEELISIKKHTDWVTQLSYSPDGVLLASGGRGGGVYVWEAETGNEFYELRGHKAGITGLAWRSDSNLLASASEDGDVLIWNMQNGKQVKKITAHGGGVLSLDWNKNGGGFMVTSGRDKKVKIWKPDFNLAKELPPFPSMVTEVVISQDGKRVFAADLSGVITVWDPATAKQIGTIASNPPSIAARIKHIQGQLVSLPVKVAELKKAFSEKEAARNAAKAELDKAEQGHRQAIEQHKKLMAERGKLDAQLKASYAKIKEFGKVREQRQNELKQAREELNKHNTAIAAVRREMQQAETETQKLTAEEKALVAHEEKARKLAEAKPEDAPAQQAAAKAKADLENHRKKLGEQKNLTQQKSTALVQLTEQQKGPGNKLAEAEKHWKQVSEQWQAMHTKIKPVQDQRNGLNQPINDVYKQLKGFEQGIKPAKEKLAKAEEAMNKPKAEYEALQRSLTNNQRELHHWQAAAVNTDALRLGKEAEDLAKQHHSRMDAFTALAKEVQELKDPAKLKEKTAELNKLRREIDQAAPTVIEKSNQAKAKQQEYLGKLSVAGAK